MQHTLGKVKCHICDQVFGTKRNKVRHIKNIHEGIFQLKCEYRVCKYGAQNQGTLESHLARCTGEKVYTCRFCEKKFALIGERNQHIKTIHKGLVRLQCNHIGCKYGTKDKHSLKAHEKRHSGAKEFKCHICGQSFAQIGFRNRHIRSIHEEVGKIKCDKLDFYSL